MADVFSMTDAYRKTQEYKEFLQEIKKDCPHMPLYLCEKAIMYHKNFPNYYKTDKQSKSVLNGPMPQPKYAKEVVVKDAFTITDMNDHILKQREDFYAEHNISEHAEFIPKVPSIEEVQV